MNPDDLTADLPSPRDDEPATLRQDIIDELSDHLHCALQRELLASGGRQSPDAFPGTFAHDTREQTAWQSVLTRFGNPAAVAYKLWWDAMKETIMTQRIVTTVTAVAVAALCVLAVLGWRRVDADRRLVFDSLESNRELMRQMTAANQELLSQFQSTQQQLSELAASGSNNPEWVPAEVIVRKGGPEGPPAEGMQVALHPRNNEGAVRAEATTDANGMADLGIVRIGYYSLTATTPLGEYLNDSVNIAPLKPFSQTIVTPAEAPSPVDATVRVVWPDGFDPKGVWILMPESSLSRMAGDDVWQSRISFDGGAGATTGFESYSIAPTGRLMFIKQATPLSGGGGFGGFGGGSRKYTWYKEFVKSVSTIRLPDAAYRFYSITFVVETPTDDMSESAQMSEHTDLVASRYGKQARSMQTLTDGSPRELVIRVPNEVVAAIETFRQNQDATTAQHISQKDEDAKG